MFDEIDALASNHGCVFTVYVDDMTVTGERSSRKLLHSARQIVGSWQLKAHKSHFFNSGKTRVVTGVAQTKDGRRLPARRQQLIAEGKAALNSATTDVERLAILRPLIGRVFEAAEVDSQGWRATANRLTKERKEIDQRLYRGGVVTLPDIPSTPPPQDGGECPGEENPLSPWEG
jgi:hypothetical protein